MGWSIQKIHDKHGVKVEKAGRGEKLLTFPDGHTETRSGEAAKIPNIGKSLTAAASASRPASKRADLPIQGRVTKASRPQPLTLKGKHKFRPAPLPIERPARKRADQPNEAPMRNRAAVKPEDQRMQLGAVNQLAGRKRPYDRLEADAGDDVVNLGSSSESTTKKKSKVQHIPTPPSSPDMSGAIADLAAAEDISPALAQAVMSGPIIVRPTVGEVANIPVQPPRIEHNSTGLIPVNHGTAMDLVVDAPLQHMAVPHPVEEHVCMEGHNTTYTQNNFQKNLYQQNNAYIQQNLADPELKPVISHLADNIMSQNVSQSEANQLFAQGLREIYQQSVQNGASAVEVANAFAAGIREDIAAVTEAQAEQAAMAEQHHAQQSAAVESVRQEVRTFSTVIEALRAQNSGEDSARKQLKTVQASMDNNTGDPNELLKVMKDVRSLLTKKMRSNVDPEDVSVPTSFMTVPRFRKNRWAPPQMIAPNEHMVFPHGPKSVTVGAGLQGKFD